MIRGPGLFAVDTPGFKIIFDINNGVYFKIIPFYAVAKKLYMIFFLQPALHEK